MTKEKSRATKSKMEERNGYARERTQKEREAERYSERRQRPFFDKLVTRRHPAAKGARG